jgi:hypothetical protein
MTTTEVTAANSYRFADNFAVVRTESGNVVCCEHNEQEAKAIAQYLCGYHGNAYHVIRNGKDAVRAAKEVRKNAPLHIKNRQLILEEMGVWA